MSNHSSASLDSKASPAPEGVRPGERFSNGEQVEVLSKLDGRWRSATVVIAWAGADLATGERFCDYDVDGEDELGPFHGRFDSDHVRTPLLVGRSQLDAGDLPTEAKPCT